MHSIGRVDPFGFRHVKITTTSVDSTSKQDTQQTPEKLLVRQQSPSADFRLKRFSPSAILLYLIRSMIRLIRQIAHQTPPQITQGLYEEILLGESSKTIKGATESETLEFLCDFLKKSPDLKNEAVLKELSQASKWAKQLEEAPILLQKKVLDTVSKNITQTITALQYGEGCVLPGGAFATFRIKKTRNGTYALELFSRHPGFPCVELVEAGGKQKVRGCVFENLSLSELTNPIWIERFLQAAQTDDPTSYNPVLANFTSRMVPSNESHIPFHASKTAICRVQNVWDMVHSTSLSKKNTHRRKLGLQLEALYGFFQQQKVKLKPDSVAYLYLKSGLTKVAKTTLVMSEDLTLVEKDHIELNLTKIDAYLKSLSPQPQNLSIPVSLKNTALSLVTPPITTDTPSISPAPPPATTTLSLPIDFYTSKKDKLRYRLDPNPDLSTRHSCVQALKALQTEIATGALSPSEEMHKITTLSLLLPLNPKQGEDIWSFLRNDDAARKQIQETSTILTELSLRLHTHLKASPSVIPRHFLGLTKLAVLTCHLAQNSGVFQQAPDLIALTQDLLTGSCFDCWNFGGVRTFRSQSLYPLQTPTEQTALDQLKEYISFSTASTKTNRSKNRYQQEYTDPRSIYYATYDDPTLALGKEKAPIPQRQELSLQLSHLLELVKKTPYQKETISRNISGWVSGKADRYSTLNLGALSREWGQSLQNPLLLAILYGFKLDGGTSKFTLEDRNKVVSKNYHDPCTYTQEAIMDNPWVAVERAFQAWREDLPDTDPLKKKTFAQVAAFAKPDLEKILSEEQLKELLINMSPSGAPWGMMGFIKKHPAILEYPAMQAFIERLLLQPGALEATCGIDSAFPELLSDFFTDHLHKFKKKNNVSAYLFLHRLHRRVVDLLPKTREAPSGLLQIQKWTNEALQPNSPLAPMRKQLLSAWVDILGSKSDLSTTEVSQYLIVSAKLHTTSSEQVIPPEEQDLLQQQYYRWLPQIQKVVEKDPALLTHSLNQICVQKGISFSPSRKWNGTFPVYRSEDGWEVNLSSLRVYSSTGLLLPTSWPTEILSHPDFKEVFPSFDPYLYPCYASKKGETLYYKTTAKGHTHLIEQQQDGTLAFFFSGTETGHKWAKRIPCHQEGGTLCTQHQLYVMGKKGFLLDRQGMVQFIVDRVSTTKTGLTLDQIGACYPKDPITKYLRGTFFDPIRYPELAPLLQLSSPSDIILWKEGKTLRHVELRNSGLFLTLQNGELIGVHPPLKGYKLDLASPPPFGLATGALFLSQDPLQKQRKWVLPRFGGHYELNPLPHQNKRSFAQLLFRLPNTLSSFHHHSLLQKWRWKWGTDHEPGIWTFDVAPSTLSILSSPKEYQGCVDLLKQALFACSTSPQEALLAANQALEQFELLPSNAISPDELEKIFYDIKQLPQQARLLEKSPSPELISLLLKTGLKMRDRGSPSIKAQWNKQIADWIPLYFKMGQKMSEQALLSPKEELLCLLLMKNYDPSWFTKHAPLLTQLHPHGSSTATSLDSLTFSPSYRSVRREAPSSPIALFELESVVKNSAEIIPGKTFVDLYEIAKTGKIAELTPVLSQLQQQIASIDEREQYSTTREKTFIRGGFSGVQTQLSQTADEKLLIMYYLEAIFACRIQDPTLQLPDFNSDLAFVKSLQNALITSASKRSQESQPSSDAIEKLKKVVADTLCPIEGIDQIEVLEERLASSDDGEFPPQSLSIQPQKGSSLLTQQELELLFKKNDFTYDFTCLKLKDLPETPAIQKAKEKLEQEIHVLEKSPIIVHSISTDNAQRIRSLLTLSLTELAAKAEKARVEIDMTLQESDPRIHHSLRELAGQVSRPSWAECLEAYLQNDFSALKAKTKDKINIDNLKAQMKTFFLLETQRRHTELALREVAEFLDVPALQKSPSAQERLYEVLSRPRYFDPDAYPQLLVMEYGLGFFLKEEQLQMGIDFIQKPNCIRQAVTGAGKTSAILPFVGLMKANGHNLVTLKFLDPLFSANLAAVQKLLGPLKKKAVPLLFSADTPLVIEKSVNDNIEHESVFKEMYERVQKVILQKGCVITNKKTQPLLQAKLIELHHKLAHLPSESHSPMDIQHMLYLGKLLALFKEREETLYDEIDKFLSSKEELHLRLDAGKPIPQYISDTALEIFDILLQNKTLSLRDNGQDHLSEEQQRAILHETAVALSSASHEKHDALDPHLLEHYFDGTISLEEEARFLTSLKELDPIEQDKIALQKDLLKILSTTLFKAADKDYKRSNRDGESVIPCAYADTPKEGSEYDDVRVRLCYLIQYVYQKGVSFDSFVKWVKELKEEAEKGLVDGTSASLQETPEEQLFQSYFPEASLKDLNTKTLQNLHKMLGEDPALLRRFLLVMTQKLRMPGTRITLNPHNQVSTAKSSSGTSATLGCLEGMHRNFTTKDLASSTAQGKMIHRLLKRVGNKKTIEYDPTKPEEIVPSLLEQETTAKVLIDGAGALRGVPGDRSAHQLQEKAGLEAVAYFDLAGDVQSTGSGPAEKTGCIYSHAQARGADRALRVDHRAVLIVNGKTSQEEVSQNEGRLRKEDQPLTIAVPRESSIKNVGDLVNAGLIQQAKSQAELLFLSKQQELQDHVHTAMVDNLVTLSSRGNIREGLELYKRYQKTGLLVSTHQEDWEESGAYFRLHQHIERAIPPLQVLEKTYESYAKIAEDLGLTTSLEETFKKMQKLEALLPETVSSTLETDKEAQVEVETETETETSIETETELETVTEKPGVLPPYYLPWNWISLYTTSYHRSLPAFDYSIDLSPNFAPAFTRNALAPPTHQRNWHDPKQSRLRYVLFGGCRATALDQLDFEQAISSKKQTKDVCIYDTVLHRYVIGGPITEITKEEQNRRSRMIAQMRFADGQHSGYTEEEWNALRTWIQEQKDPKVLETYFLEQVLKHRPKERERYKFSALASVFKSILQSTKDEVEKTD